MVGWAAGAWLSRNKKIPSGLVAGTMIKGWGSCRERDRIVRGRDLSLCTRERGNSTTSLLLQIVILDPRIWLQTNPGSDLFICAAVYLGQKCPCRFFERNWRNALPLWTSAYIDEDEDRRVSRFFNNE